MKNFLRALRHAWPYRRRFILSVLCATMAAMLWGLNFTSVYPVLKLLNNNQTPQQWVDGCVSDVQADINQLEPQEQELQDKLHDIDGRPTSNLAEKEKRDATNELARVERRLGAARTLLWRYEVARKYIYMLAPPDRFQTLAWVIGILVVVVAVKCFFEFGQESLVGSVVNLSLFDLRNRFYRNVIHLDVDQFGEQGSSELTARFTNDMESLGAGTKMLLGKVVAEPLRALACIVGACFISWQLTLLFLVLVPIAVFILSKVGRIMKRATRRLLERMSSIYKILQESFQGIRVVKAFTMESAERRRFKAATRDYYRRAMMVVNIDALSDPIIEVLAVAAVAGALLAGSYLVMNKETHLFGIPWLHIIDQQLDAEALLSLYILLAAISDPVRKLSSVFTRIQSGCAAADRIFSYIDKQPRVRGNSDGPRFSDALAPQETAAADRSAAASRPKASGTLSYFIEFRDVCFSYEPEQPVLSNIHLGVHAGETVALVGANGCGKSTLVSLLPRFYDPSHGTILINGHDLRTVHTRSLRRQIGVVTQEVILFDDTIFSNIVYGARRATQEQVEEAARKAFAHDFIVQLPRGYQTRVGELGRGVSGGQKQRLALARAILRNPRILILDEFTSAIDVADEALIHQALREFKVGRTTFLITHRLNTLEIADRIVVLDRGRITAVGVHDELMRSSPLYQRLHESQTQRRVA
ncbi:MAG TPA: ABC transporter ATP-binding protein [Gemmataceae bacterium]|nr:ABC transporter ATP-binding protein [Gemmataceae bacterium]